jgi:uncharacterized protein YndB with AHSA1/START domain
MSVDRTIEHEVEVAGTPEQVWQAIATGQGITGWFVPAKVEERAGGAIELHFGPVSLRPRRRGGHSARPAGLARVDHVDV